MDKKLEPMDLRSFIDKDSRFRRAEAILTNQWESLFYQKSSVSRHLASFYDAAIGHQALLK